MPAQASTQPLLTEFVLELVVRLAGLEPAVADRLRGVPRAKELLMALVREGGLTRVAARAIHLAFQGRYEIDDIRQLVQPATLHEHLTRMAGFGDTHRPADLSATQQVSVDPQRSTQTTRMPSGPARLPRVGAELGKCLLVEQLGQGGVGVVYRAFHRGLGKTVAVKVLRGDLLAQDGGLLERLRGEARLLAAIEHPNVVRIHDFDDNPTTPYLTLECIEGPSLAELIEQSGNLRADRALNIARQMAEALRVAWMRGVVHRDLKPANVLLTRDGVAKITDFGLAMVISSREASEAGSQGVVGTAAYMPPEQIRTPGSVDHRSDMYALGVTLYQMLTGVLPFRGTSTAAVWFQHLQAAPLPPEGLVPGLPASVSDFVMRLMAKEPEGRFADYDSLLLALDDLLGGC